MREKKREGGTKCNVGLYKMLQIPTLLPKCPRSGVTFHYVSVNFCLILLRKKNIKKPWQKGKW